MKIYLKKNEEKRILAGHPWIYANEVARVEDREKNGSLCSVHSFDGKFLGKGYVNYFSKILVRIFIKNADETDDKEFYLKKLKEADDFRKALGYGNCYRMVFAEADNLPALIVDKYADYLVIQCLSLGIDLRKPLIIECLAQLFNPKGIYERSDVPVRLKEGLKEFKGTVYGEVPDKVLIEENGLKMLVDVKNGQKTEYFLDQKENRLAVRRYAKGTVLDCFCNSGGFSINCATVADRVVAVDISQAALGSLKENAELNNLNNIETVCGDVFNVLREYKKQGKRFDTIILDPPAFCKSASEIKDAYRGYKDINLLAMKLINSGGFLITSSCSHYMSAANFAKMLAEAASESGRRVRLLEVRQQSPDHPSLLSAEETQYLKFFVLQVI